MSRLDETISLFVMKNKPCFYDKIINSMIKQYYEAYSLINIQQLLTLDSQIYDISWTKNE